MNLELSQEIWKGLEEKAKDVNISVESAIRLILGEYIRVHGSRIYAGTWRRGDRGNKKGMRYVIDWPFQPGLVKIPGDRSLKLKNQANKER